MIDRKLTQKIREEFNHDYVQVNTALSRIEVYWFSGNGKVWVPYGGGPIYGNSAKDTARWLYGHIEKYRSLLPKKLRDYKIVLGELQTNTFPGVFVVKDN